MTNEHTKTYMYMYIASYQSVITYVCTLQSAKTIGVAIGGLGAIAPPTFLEVGAKPPTFYKAAMSAKL